MSCLLKKSFEVSSVGTSFICHVLSSMECKIHMTYVSIAFEGLNIDIFWTFFAGTKIWEVIKHAIDAIEAIDAIDAIIK